MGTSSANARTNENQNLLNYGFRFFEGRKIYEAKKQLTEARVWKGEAQNVPLGLESDLNVTIPRRHYVDLKAEMMIDKKVSAPITEGMKLGTIKITLKNDVVATADLIALKSVKQGNIFQRMYDNILMMKEKSNDKK